MSCWSSFAHTCIRVDWHEVTSPTINDYGTGKKNMDDFSQLHKILNFHLSHCSWFDLNHAKSWSPTVTKTLKPRSPALHGQPQGLQRRLPTGLGRALRGECARTLPATPEMKTGGGASFGGASDVETWENVAKAKGSIWIYHLQSYFS